MPVCVFVNIEEISGEVFISLVIKFSVCYYEFLTWNSVHNYYNSVIRGARKEGAIGQFLRSQ